jgi:hypothetical protein
MPRRAVSRNASRTPGRGPHEVHPRLVGCATTAGLISDNGCLLFRPEMGVPIGRNPLDVGTPCACFPISGVCHSRLP